MLGWRSRPAAAARLSHQLRVVGQQWDMPADTPIPARLVTIYTLVGSQGGQPWKVGLAEKQTRQGSYHRFSVDRHGQPYARLAAEGRIGQYKVEEIATILRDQPRPRQV